MTTKREDLHKKLLLDREYADTAGVRDRAGKPLKLCLADGRLVSPLGEQGYRNARFTSMREDDVLLCGYQKTGTHWTWEILCMILRGHITLSPAGKFVNFLEFAPPDLLESFPSPRVLNTHMQYDWLPEEAREKKTKIVLTFRNPKDTAVSLYNHHKKYPAYNYQGMFDDWFQLYLDGKVDNGNYFDYYASWEQAVWENPDHPICVVRYEDMKQDVKSTIRRLGKFLSVQLTEKCIDEIAKVSDFCSMKEEFKGTETESILRKGQVGDWVNWLSEDQSEALDKEYRNKMADTAKFRPKYSL